MARKITVGPDVDLDTEEVILPSGRRYTEADAQADAEYFESQARPGRPSLAHGVSPQVSFRVPQAIKDDLANVAKRLGRPEARVAREALTEYLKRHHGA